MQSFLKLARLMSLLIACASLSACDDVRVYGSVGYSNYSGYRGYHGGGMRTGVTVGGRIY